MKKDGIPTAVYYPRPMHTQTPYARYPVAKGGLEVTEALAADGGPSDAPLPQSRHTRQGGSSVEEGAVTENLGIFHR